MKPIKSGQLIPVRTNGINIVNYVGWSIVISIALYFVYANVLRYYDLANPVYAPSPTGNKPFAPSLITHITFGTIALLIGPLQFFSGVRKKYPIAHRTIGKIYLISLLIAGATAAYLAVAHNLIVKQEFVFGTGVLGLALSWYVTAGMAYWAIRKRNFLQHQEWMIRSYVVTNGFTTFRLVLYPLLEMENFPFKSELGGVMGWACWAIPLLVTEVILQAKKINAGSKKREAHQVA